MTQLDDSTVESTRLLTQLDSRQLNSMVETIRLYGYVHVQTKSFNIEKAKENNENETEMFFERSGT